MLLSGCGNRSPGKVRKQARTGPREVQITESDRLAREIAQFAAGKKAEDIAILDMREICSYTDFFVIVSGRSTRQTRAICDEIRYQLKHGGDSTPESDSGNSALRVEGESNGDWILMDYLSVVVHIFTPEARDFYRLEVLWKEAPSLELEA